MLLVQEDASSGTFAVEAGHLVRSRSGPGGQWAKGAEDGPVDGTRRLAEAVELRLSEAVTPVLVLAGPSTSAFEGPVELRGVTVVHLRHFRQWLRELDQKLDRADFAIAADRLRRFCRTLSASRQPDDVPTDADARIRPHPGPRDWSPREPQATQPQRESRPYSVAGRRVIAASAPAGRSRRAVGLLMMTAVLGLGAFAAAPATMSSLTDGLADAARDVTGRITGASEHVPNSPVDDAASAGGPMTGREAGPEHEAVLPPAPAPVPLTSCLLLSTEDVSDLLGQPVVLVAGSHDTACHYGPRSAPDAVWLSVAIGPGSAAATLPGVNGSTRATYPAGWWPGSGHVLGTEVTVSVDVALYPGDGISVQRLAASVIADLVEGHAPTPAA